MSRAGRFALAGGAHGPSGRARSGLSLAAIYILSALVSTALNIAVQEAVRRIGPVDAIAAPMLAGTVAGFVAKYGLDKRLVFADAYRSPASELRKIAIYGAFSVGTTLLFWGSELAFWWAWQTPQARYVGAVLGLAAGYAIKFALDRAFVFRDSAA